MRLWDARIMSKIAIIIPSRLKAKRLPNKPLKLINNKEMVLHAYDVAINAKMGEVYVATPDKEIANLVQSYGGKSVITLGDHQTGTDRIFEVFQWEQKKIRDKKIELSPVFKEAFDLYRKNDLVNCLKLLKKYQKKLPNDPILRLYLERCDG